MRVTVVGLGYMGLPTALLLAREPGREVCGYDVSESRVDALRRGVLPFEEPGLEDLYRETRERFQPSTELRASDAFVLALPTPLAADRRCDASHLEHAIDALAGVVADGNLVVIESTVSPGTTLRMRERLRAASGSAPVFSYVSEKAIPGNTLHEMVHNDRIIGIADEAARAPTEALYRSFVAGALVFTDATTAEAAKLFENTFRDVNIALANELADVSERLGIDVHETIALANRHPRVDLLSPGPGVGGHCIAIDPWFLIENEPDAALIRAARAINDARPGRVVARLRRHLPPPASVALLGAAYKADVDDDRESPSGAIRAGLEAAGYEVRTHDPFVARSGVSADLEAVLRGADAAVLVTPHGAYRGLDLSAAGFAGSLIVDTRGTWAQVCGGDPRYVLLGAG